MANGGLAEAKMHSSPCHPALTGEVIFHDSNAKFQRVMGVAHKIAPYSVGVQLLGCSSGPSDPLAEFGANLVPGLGIVSTGMKTFSKLDLSAHKETTELLRRRVEAGIARSGLNFIVLIDDLDRLEPAQAVEVLHLIRSVADFSGFRYILCYDPGVLAHAIERELGVPDGKLYLQKIIPLSFTLPHHEVFDLKRELLLGALALFEQVNQDVPTEAELAHLRKVAWIYGQELSTPREVALVLSVLEFWYAGIRDYVYFPTCFFLQLIRVTNAGLYDGTEQYLARFFVFVSGGARLY